MGESPGPVPCRGCGGALDEDAKFCARCGRSRDLVDATMIELRPLGTIMSAQQTAVVTSRPPDRKRSLSLLGAVAVIALVAFGLVKTFEGDSADEATSPTSTLLATTTIPETTTAPPTTAAPTTTAPRTTTSLAPPATTTTIPYVNQRRGVLLDEAQSARSFYFANGADLHRVELGTGRVTSRRFSGTNGIGVYGFVDGRLVLSGVNGQNLGWLAADLSGEVTNIDLGQFTVNGTAWVGADGIWAVRSTNDAGAVNVARRFDLAGKVRAEVRFPPNMYPWGSSATEP